MQELEKPQLQENTELAVENTKTSILYPISLIGAVLIVILLFVALYITLQPPKSFPVPSTVVLSTDQTVTMLIDELYAKQYINSPVIFKIFLKLSGREHDIPAGQYYFDMPLSVGALAHRFVEGDFNQTKIKLTIPEGKTVRQVATLVESRFPQIRADDFVEYAQKYEGYLFPDTYFFYQDISKEHIVEKMRNTFSEKVDPIWAELSLSEIEKKQMIILASLLEEEGKTLQDKKMIAGILLNRLKQNMPLQVDATINYIKGEATRVYFSELTIESEYNTYLNRGLPPGPISSPGLVSLQAALSPIPSSYLYYLTGTDGRFHYAKTFDEHVRNKALYLK
ncbi:MAG: hypothetical protein RI996_293 [Candidatus Parcubacteria bacterium]|jgi:UPF0755 protein